MPDAVRVLGIGLGLLLFVILAFLAQPYFWIQLLW
jgi:hypothetical protein